MEPQSKTTNDGFADLIEKAKALRREMEVANEASRKKMAEISARVDASVKIINELHCDLEQKEKEANDALDKLAIQQAEDLAG
jgi:hypothetical protein